MISNKIDPSQYPARLVRKAHFSCGHRYSIPGKSEQENRALFGELYSPHGFGHNFILEAHVEGTIDPVTGMVVNLSLLDRWLKEVVMPLDHHFLNDDVDYFKEHLPSVENITVYLYDQLNQRIKSSGLNLHLFKVRLHESDELWVDHSDLPDVTA